MTTPASSGPLAKVDDVLITAELANRPSRAPDYESEGRALALLAEEMATNPRGVLQKCAELVMELCHADSAGISILEPGATSGMLRWQAAAGTFAPNLNGTMPAEASPCGTVMERNCFLLFQEAERFFPALRGVKPRIYENLLTPWHVDGKAVGTLWAIKHTPEGRFDAEDARVLQSLARFAAAAFQMTSALDEATAERSALRASEEKYRTLFDSIDEGFCIYELIEDETGRAIDIRYLETNPAFEQQMGFRPLPGQTVRELVPDIEDSWIEINAEAARTGQSQHFENFARELHKWFEVRVLPLATHPGRRLAGIFADITERKRAEAGLRESEERQAFLLRFSDALRAEPNAHSVAERAIRMLADQMELDRCYITFYRPSDDEADFPYQVGNDSVPALPSKVRLSDFPDAYEQVLDHTYIVEDDFERRGLTEAERSNSNALGMRAMLASTIRKGAKNPLCSMVAVSSTPRRWTVAEIALIEEAAERTWAAMERARVETALRESEAHLAAELERTELLRELALRVVAENISSTIYADVLSTAVAITGADAGTVQVYEPETKSLVLLVTQGIPPAMAEYFHRVDASSTTACGMALKTDQRTFIDFDADDADEACRMHVEADLRSAQATPLLSRDGSPIGMINTHWRRSGHRPGQDQLRFLDLLARQTADLIERRRDAEALRASEERFRQFANASAAGLWIRDADSLAMEFVSPAIGPIYGVEPDALMGEVKHWAAMILPEDREAALNHLEQARRGETAVHEFRIQRPADGAFRWIRNTDFPLRDNGNIPRIGGIAEDVTEAKLAVEHQGVLLAELQHRVRNIMAMIRSMARRSADGAVDVDDYRVLLEGRLLALARVQTLLTRQANAGGSLRDIVESEVGAQAHHGGQFELAGPDVHLSPKAVEVLTLALHELATNALKYGALSAPEGRLRVEWASFEKRGRTWLSIDWTETGAPSRGPATRRGFGSDLIEGKIPYELGGTGAISIEASGAHCRLEFPLKEGESILETDAPTPTTVFGGMLDMTGAPDLTGRCVLVVEDDYYIAGDTAAALRGAGATVLGPCPSEDATLDLLGTATPTHAVLDLNLGGGGPRFEIAHALKERGVPFIFLTGYDPDAVPPDLADVLRLQKPVTFSSIVEAVAQL